MRYYLITFIILFQFSSTSFAQKDTTKKFAIDISTGIGNPLLTNNEGEEFGMAGIHCSISFIYKPKSHGGWTVFFGITRNSINTASFAAQRNLMTASADAYYNYESMLGYSFFSDPWKNLTWHIRFLIGIATVKVPSINGTYSFGNVAGSVSYSSVMGNSLDLGISTGLKYQFSKHFGSLLDVSYSTATLNFDPSVTTFLGGGTGMNSRFMNYTTYLDLLKGTIGIEYDF